MIKKKIDKIAHKNQTNQVLLILPCEHTSDGSFVPLLIDFEHPATVGWSTHSAVQRHGHI